MEQTTYPNQKLITIHKKKYERNFLQIGKEEWMDAFANLSPSAFGVYLYLCGNKNGYRLALSSAALRNALRFSDSSYRRAVKELGEKGYLVQNGSSGNVLDFYFVPKRQKNAAVHRERAAAPVAPEPSTSQDNYDQSFSFSHAYPPGAYGWEDT